MHIHILGICGTFMGGIAALAREAGHKVTGCDANVYPPMSDQLRALGIDLIEDYSADQLRLKPDIYVVGNVVKRGNPLMEAILNAALPYTSGPQWLAEHVLTGRHVFAVAGTHGKTTTTAMLAWILQACGFEPGFLVGGVPSNFGVSARMGALHMPFRAGFQASVMRGNAFVIEADEYDTAFFDKRSKFVHYRPRTAVLNNLEYDHADIFPDLKAIETQFHHLVRTVPGIGRLVINGTQQSLQRVIAQGCWSEKHWFAPNASGFLDKNVSPQWCIDGTAQDFAVIKDGQSIAQVKWSLQGAHNQLNALAAIAAAEHIGVTPVAAAQALAHFHNVKRRMEIKGVVAGVTVYDDFAHHPTAIRTTIAGLREQLAASGKPGRILAVFEPRSNTMKLGTVSAQLPWALELADLIYCYSDHLQWDANAVLSPLGDKVHVIGDLDNLVEQVCLQARPGDAILCMSNGGFGGIHAKLITKLQAKI